MDKKFSFIIYNFIKKNRSIYKFFLKFTNASKIFFSFIYFSMSLYLLFTSNTKLKPFLLSTFFSIICTNIIKIIFKRKRPYSKSNSYSFPSNHAATSMIISISCLYINLSLGFVLIIISLFVGLSRIFIGAHYLSDIIAGFLISILISFLCFALF